MFCLDICLVNVVFSLLCYDPIRVYILYDAVPSRKYALHYDPHVSLVNFLHIGHFTTRMNVLFCGYIYQVHRRTVLANISHLYVMFRPRARCILLISRILSSRPHPRNVVGIKVASVFVTSMSKLLNMNHIQ